MIAEELVLLEDQIQPSVCLETGEWSPVTPCIKGSCALNPPSATDNLDLVVINSDPASSDALAHMDVEIQYKCPSNDTPPYLAPKFTFVFEEDVNETIGIVQNIAIKCDIDW